MLVGEFRDTRLECDFPLLPALFFDRALRFFAQRFEETITEKFRTVAFGATAEGEDLVEKDLPRPRRKVRPELELMELTPHHDFPLLEDILGILRAGDETGHVDAESSFVFSEETQKGLGAIILRLGDSFGVHGAHGISRKAGRLDRRKLSAFALAPLCFLAIFYQLAAERRESRSLGWRRRPGFEYYCPPLAHGVSETARPSAAGRRGFLAVELGNG